MSPPWQRNLLQYGANSMLREFFHGSLRLESGGFRPGFTLALQGLTAELKTRDAQTALAIREIVSEDSLLGFLTGQPVRFRFRGLKTGRSSYEGGEGLLTVRGGKDAFMDFRCDVKSLGLEDLTWLNPSSLEGSTGMLKGTLTLRSDARRDPVLGMELLVQEPGGLIQAQFFDVLRPYLPAFKEEQKLRALTAEKKLLPYRNAALIVSMKESDRMKVFLHIMIPGYNVNLNLNLEIKADKKNAFTEIAQLMGLFEVALP